MSSATIKDAREISIMRQAGRIAATALHAAAQAVRPGMTTLELDGIAHQRIVEQGAIPTFINYDVRGKPFYKHATCISINEEIVHGIPRADRIISEGDIISIDVGATFEGYVGDCALTVACGEIRPRARRLLEASREALEEAIKIMRPGVRIFEISRAIQAHATVNGFGVVRNYSGHGVGRRLHEPPSVPNYSDPRESDHDVILVPGMVLAIEPMLTEGVWKTRELADGWTVVTGDKKLSSHWEHTVAVTENGAEILTVPVFVEKCTCPETKLKGGESAKCPACEALEKAGTP